MTEFRKAEGEENARNQGEDESARTIQRVTQGLNCSSFCSFAAIVSASRFVLNVPMRTRNDGAVPFGRHFDIRGVALRGESLGNRVGVAAPVDRRDLDGVAIARTCRPQGGGGRRRRRADSFGDDAAAVGSGRLGRRRWPRGVFCLATFSAFATFSDFARLVGLFRFRRRSAPARLVGSARAQHPRLAAFAESGRMSSLTVAGFLIDRRWRRGRSRIAPA